MPELETVAPAAPSATPTGPIPLGGSVLTPAPGPGLPVVLVVDDEENIRNLLRLLLKKEGYRPILAEDGEQAIDLAERHKPDLVLLDVNLPKLNGLEVLRKLRERRPAPKVLMMSAYGSLDATLEAIRAGADDYVNKPFRNEELLLALRKTEERERLRRENLALRRSIAAGGRRFDFVTENRRMKELLATIDKVARVKTTVLIQGESGTGKELIARMIHDAGDRAPKPFVAVNCGAIPASLIESELFGYVKGAFTDAQKDKRGLFEEAQGGTLFLDEIGDLPLPLQVTLLRVLQENEIRRVGDTRAIPVDVRILSATAADLADAVAEGRFREDLYFRLNVFSLRVPPLRERPDDVVRLADYFRVRFNEKLGLDVSRIEPDALDLMTSYHWPGNVRELENTIERAMILCEGGVLHAADLPPKLREESGGGHFVLHDDEYSIKRAGERLEQELIRRALRKTGGNRTMAAKLLEISHRALLYKIKDYGVTD